MLTKHKTKLYNLSLILLSAIGCSQTPPANQNAHKLDIEVPYFKGKVPDAFSDIQHGRIYYFNITTNSDDFLKLFRPEAEKMHYVEHKIKPGAFRFQRPFSIEKDDSQRIYLNVMDSLKAIQGQKDFVKSSGTLVAITVSQKA